MNWRFAGSVFILIVWTILGIYFGSGGWIAGSVVEKANAVKDFKPMSDGQTTYDTPQQAYYYLAKESYGGNYPWLFMDTKSSNFGFAMLAFIGPLVAAFSAALVGGVAQVLKLIALEKVKVDDSNPIAIPVFSAFVGAMVFFLVTMIPEAMLTKPAAATGEASSIKISAITAIGIFAGLFAKDAFAYIEKQIKHHLTK